MLTISGMTKAFGERVLFEDVSLQVNRGDRIGLVGPNGAGKSTLFSLVLGHDTPDTGEVSIERKATIGHLPQETAPVGDETVLELATAITPEVVELQRRMKAFEAGHDTESHDFHEVQARFDALGGYQLEPRAKTILARARVPRARLRPAAARDERRLGHARAPGAPARPAARPADARRADQPPRPRSAAVVPGLPEVLPRRDPADLARPRVPEPARRQHRGDPPAPARSATAATTTSTSSSARRRTEQLLAAYKNQQKKIEQLQEFADRFRAKASKASQAQSKLKQIERMDKIEAPVQRRPVHQVPVPPAAAQRAGA